MMKKYFETEKVQWLEKDWKRKRGFKPKKLKKMHTFLTLENFVNIRQ